MNTLTEAVHNAFHFLILQSIVGGIHDIIVHTHRN